jgi:ParB family chromosome partitioning protein
MASKAMLPEEYNVLRERVASLFQTKVQMSCSPTGKGKISISFANEEELERIMHVLDSFKG